MSRSTKINAGAPIVMTRRRVHAQAKFTKAAHKKFRRQERAALRQDRFDALPGKLREVANRFDAPGDGKTFFSTNRVPK